jgi:hypothetical protein
VYRRQYPNITVTTSQNQLADYTETAWSAGASLRLFTAERMDVQATGSFRQTDSRDPFFDAESYTVSGNLDTRLFSSLYVSVSGVYQDRSFANRVVGDDHDDYWQVGAGVRYTVFNGVTAAVRGVYSDYTWTDGSAEDGHRIGVEIRYAWGRGVLPPPIRVDIETLSLASDGSVQQPDGRGNVRFRIRAPGAERVAVAGDFNDWDPASAPLRRAEDGWWETRIALDPGRYEYVYVIDGKWTTPPEAKITVNDGFGGRNGIIEVLSPGL